MRAKKHPCLLLNLMSGCDEQIADLQRLISELEPRISTEAAVVIDPVQSIETGSDFGVIAASFDKTLQKLETQRHGMLVVCGFDGVRSSLTRVLFFALSCSVPSSSTFSGGFAEECFQRKCYAVRC